MIFDSVFPCDRCGWIRPDCTCPATADPVLPARPAPRKVHDSHDAAVPPDPTGHGWMIPIVREIRGAA